MLFAGIKIRPWSKLEIRKLLNKEYSHAILGTIGSPVLLDS